MISPITTRQFERVREKFAHAELQPLPSGAALIIVPDFALPAGWNASSTCVRFIAPVGYPGPNPDCFWATVGLRLADGRMPQAANEQQIPETSHQGVWFSWHINDAQNNWNPNRDDLMTYISIIGRRFAQAQ